MVKEIGAPGIKSVPGWNSPRVSSPFRRKKIRGYVMLFNLQVSKVCFRTGMSFLGSVGRPSTSHASASIPKAGRVVVEHFHFELQYGFDVYFHRNSFAFVSQSAQKNDKLPETSFLLFSGM